jgi:predicted DNA-binding transcriptional regulator YafY
VLRNMEALEAQNWARLESFIQDGQRCYRMSPAGRRPNLSFTPDELAQLALCRDLVAHLLPNEVRERVGGSLGKTGLMLDDPDCREEVLSSVAGAKTKGSVDYSPFQAMIETLLEAIRDRRVCEVSYHAASRDEPKTYHFAPMRLVSFRDSLYVAGHVVCSKGTPEIRHTVPLCVHRLQSIVPTRRVHDFPTMPEEGERHFGFMPGEPFRCVARFDEPVVRYVAERRWSSEQTLRELEDGGVELTFTATSMPEVAGWILSFGGLAEAVSPAQLREDVARQARRIAERHEGEG